MKPRVVAARELDLAEFIGPGDGIVWGQVTGEPVPLAEAFIEQRHRYARTSLFLGASFSETVQPDHSDVVDIRAIGGVGSNRRLSKAGVLDVVPVHLSAIAGLLRSAAIPCDVAMVQLTPSDDPGFFNYAVVADYIVAAVETARLVIGEVNHRAPRTKGPHRVSADRIACLVETDRPVLSLPQNTPGDVEREIAAHIAHFIEDGSTLQVGIGAVPDAVLSLIRDRRDLGVHSGMIGDSVVDLVEAGVVTNSRKPIDTGITVTGTLIGTERLYRFADNNPALELHSTGHTHDIRTLAQLPKLVSLNSAVEVDLTGQVNAEVAGGIHLGAVGGQVDYVRGAVASSGGVSIVALPSTAARGTRSRIVPALSGPVTTSRSDVDVVVTEFGSARLRGRSLKERARALVEIAHPAFREDLDRFASAP